MPNRSPPSFLHQRTRPPVGKRPPGQTETRESPSASRSLWLVSNGPGIVTVLGSAVVAVLASIISFSTEALLQIVLALMALIGTSLVTDQLVEGRKDREQITSISSRLDTVVSFARNQSVSLDEVVVSRRQLPPLEEASSAPPTSWFRADRSPGCPTSTAACSNASPGKAASSGSS